LAVRPAFFEAPADVAPVPWFGLTARRSSRPLSRRAPGSQRTGNLLISRVFGSRTELRLGHLDDASGPSRSELPQLDLPQSEFSEASAITPVGDDLRLVAVGLSTVPFCFRVIVVIC